MQIPLGFEVGTGAPVEIPLAHTFVSGQTQQSGKTTTLRAIVERSGKRALAFVTKRGEEFTGRPIRPYLPREGETPIHWRMVETILASALEQKNLKWERFQIINAAKGARSLEDVQVNVRRLLAKAKDGKAKEIYALLEEYIDLVLPQMRGLNASHTLELQPGLNVMDLTGIAAQTQAMVIRAALERINHHETDVLTVLPEAWEFAPRGRSAPAKDEAIAMARKGAAPKVRNFLLVDSQDIAGVENVVRQACSVWLLGVQRELNEVKRALQMMTSGVKRPKPEQVATLELGQFFVCYGAHAIKTYVQPAWMGVSTAVAIATGRETVTRAWQIFGPDAVKKAAVQEDTVNESEARALREENDQLKRDNAELRQRLDALEKGSHDLQTGNRSVAGQGNSAARHADARSRPGTEQTRSAGAGDGRGSSGAGSTGARTFTPQETFDNEALYQAFKARLIAELPDEPTLVKVIVARPELQVLLERHTITVDGSSLRGRIARLIADDFFGGARTSAQVLDELLKRGADRPSNIELGNEMKNLCDMGFFTRDNKWYSLTPNARVNVLEK